MKYRRSHGEDQLITYFIENCSLVTNDLKD